MTVILRCTKDSWSKTETSLCGSLLPYVICELLKGSKEEIRGKDSLRWETYEEKDFLVFRFLLWGLEAELVTF